MKYSKYEIDITHEVSLDEVLKSFAGHGLRLELYERVGPGGGNQRFIISGRPQDWNAWCMENYSEEPESHKIGSINA